MGSSAEATPLFLTGFAKSGTTLLLSLLDGHPDLCVFPREVGFFTKVQPRIAQGPREAVTHFVDVGLREPLFGMDRKLPIDVDPDVYEDLLVRRWEATGWDEARFLDLAVLTWGDVSGQQGRRYWVEKTPRTELWARFIEAWYPDARMVFVVRDPRANWSAYRTWQDGKQHDMTLPYFVCRWERSLRANERNAKRLAVHTIRYEDLVLHTRKTLEGICRFLAIDFDDILLQPTLAGHPFSGNSAYGGTFRGVEASSLDRWKERVSDREVREIEYLLGDRMRQFEYSFASEERERRLFQPGMLAAWIRTWGWHARTLAPEGLRDSVRTHILRREAPPR